MVSSILSSIFLLSGACLVVQARLLGTTECTYGPAYWCGSLRNAKQCSAVGHCIQTVWEKQQLPEDNDDICGICKNMVQQARDQLESNQTQEELKAVFEGSCRLIPLSKIAAECVELADEFIPELIEMLASQMNPQIVCATAGLCNSVRIDRLLREHGLLHTKPVKQTGAVASSGSTDPNPGDCSDCRKYIQDVITLVRDHSKQELLDHLLSICSELGSVSDGCSALMFVNLDAIHDFIANKLKPAEACSLFGMCGNLFGPVPPASSANTGDEVCDFCVVIAQHWRDVLTSNATEEQFKEILHGFCQQAGSFKDECSSLVDNYYLAVYNYFMNEFDPKKLCEVVGICKVHTTKAVWTTLHTGPQPADAPLLTDEEHSRTKDLPSLKFVGQDEANSYKHQEKEATTDKIPRRAALLPSIKISVAGESGVLKGSNQICTMCEFTLHFIQIQLQDKTTKKEIEDAVKSVCSHLPKDLSEQCDDYIDAYGDQVIALLQQEIDPSVMCPLLGLCPSKSSSGVVSIAVAPKADVTCVACEYIMVKVKDMLADKTNQDEIRDALDKVCGLMPRSLDEECQTFIDENAIEVIQLLAGGVDPEQMCRLLGFCHDNMGRLPPLDSSNQLPISRLFIPNLRPANTGVQSLEQGGQSKVCVVCEFILSMVEKLILDNNTHIADKIEQAVEQVCLLMPTTLQDDCLGFVEQYSQSLIELLVSGISPKFVCRELHLCKPPRLDFLPHVIVTRSAPGAADTSTVSEERQCLICTAVVTTYKGSDADSGGDMTTIRSAIADVCDALTGDEKQLCTDIDVTTVKDEVKKHSSSNAVCSALHYCAADRHLPGSNKCTWGPAYWCESVLHAQSCGTISHCQEIVWQGVSPVK